MKRLAEAKLSRELPVERIEGKRRGLGGIAGDGSTTLTQLETCCRLLG
jgi:hypothetical protein